MCAGLHRPRPAAGRRHHPVRLPGLGPGQQLRLLHRGRGHLRRLLLPASRAHRGVPGKNIWQPIENIIIKIGAVNSDQKYLAHHFCKKQIQLYLIPRNTCVPYCII